MQKQVVLAKECFDRIERDIVETTKSLIESFKFKMIYSNVVSKKQNERAIAGLKKFRAKNWDKKLSRDDAYRKYIASY